MSLRSSGAVALLALSASFAACYDHRFTQQIIENRRRAREAEGAEIRASHTAQAPGAMRMARLRFYAAKGFSDQHREWKHMLTAMADAANGIVGPSFKIRFELAAVNEWTPKCDQTRLASCVDELAKLDAADDGDWVIGVLGAEPSFTTTFEHLGMAHSLGHHFVVRDVSDLAERAAIDSAFASSTQERRDEIYKRRKSHKRLTVFLHEWGHTLGALHVANDKSLLNPYYDDSMQAFDDANTGLIDASLRDLYRYAGTHDELKAYLHGSAADGLPGEERNDLLTRLEGPPPAQQPPEKLASSTASGALPEHPFLVRGKEDELLLGVEQTDRDLYRQAAQLTVAGDSAAAITAMKPLGPRYPDNYAVQHLLCNLAMQLSQQATAEESCPRAMAGAGVRKGR